MTATPQKKSFPGFPHRILRIIKGRPLAIYIRAQNDLSIKLYLQTKTIIANEEGLCQVKQDEPAMPIIQY